MFIFAKYFNLPSRANFIPPPRDMFWGDFEPTHDPQGVWGSKLTTPGVWGYDLSHTYPKETLTPLPKPDLLNAMKMFLRTVGHHIIAN